MAKIIAGAAIPRGPLLRTPPEKWSEVGERDKTNPWLTNLDGTKTTYDELLKNVSPSVQKETTLEVWRERFQAGQDALKETVSTFHKADPDVVLVMGDDEFEWFKDDNTRPKLAIYNGPDWTWEGKPYPVAVEMTNHVINHLKQAGYEVQVFDKVPAWAPDEPNKMPHSFGLVNTQLMKSVKPMVPIMVNVHYAVNQTTPVWSYQLGQEVRKAVESAPGSQTVAVCANGGMSIGVLREDLDRRFIDAMKKRDVAALGDIPYKWIQGPCGETYNWIGAAGVLEGLNMNVAGYVPGYRSPAGTGCGMAFATWG